MDRLPFLLLYLLVQVNSKHKLIAKKRETKARYIKVITVVYINVLCFSFKVISYIRNINKCIYIKLKDNNKNKKADMILYILIFISNIFCESKVDNFCESKVGNFCFK